MINQALNLLKENKTGSFKLPNDTVLVITPNAIAYRYFVKYRKEVQQDVLAARIGEAIVGNSSVLEGYQNHMRDGYRKRAVVTDEQLALSELVAMIPFTVMKQANLDLNSFREIDKGEAETLKRRETRTQLTANQLEKLKEDPNVVDLVSKKVDATGWDAKKGEKRFDVTYNRKQHFAGARLFACTEAPTVDPRIGRNPLPAPKDKVFLLDIDRKELQHGLINPFLVELQDPTVETIAEAYESLKPDEVIKAEESEMLVERQGEWFFIPIDPLSEQRAEKTHKAKIEEESRGETATWRRMWAGRGELRAGRNRPNTVEAMIEIEGKYFVKGTVSHSGREHKDLKLTRWHQAIPNTSQSSWTITGDVD